MELHAAAPRPDAPAIGAARREGAAHRLQRVLVAACLIALAPALISFSLAMLEPSNSSLGIRSVEWLRDNGGGGLVTKVESIYYTLTAPAKGGPSLRSLPHVGLGGAASAPGLGRSAAGTLSAPAVLDRPRRIVPLGYPPLRGEGVWSPTQPGESRTDPPLLVSSFRSDPHEYPRLVAGVAWINTSRTVTALYAGRLEPSVSLPSRGPMEVPTGYRRHLLATFNSGFKLSDAGGGWALHGHTYVPMRDGQATFVRYANGRYDVADWRGGPIVAPDVVFARQNLPLIVFGAHTSPRLSDGPEWGATLGNAIQVWRSAIGVDARGNLIYGAANDQTVRSLAQIMIHAGAVRAMELDINSYWVSFNTYAAPGALRPSKLLEAMERPSARYLSADDRDFFAVYER